MKYIAMVINNDGKLMWQTEGRSVQDAICALLPAINDMRKEEGWEPLPFDPVPSQERTMDFLFRMEMRVIVEAVWTEESA